jgi:hypothetical protein
VCSACFVFLVAHLPKISRPFYRQKHSWTYLSFSRGTRELLYMCMLIEYILVIQPISTVQCFADPVIVQ